MGGCDGANYVFVLSESPFELTLDNAQTSFLARDVLHGRALRFARVVFDPCNDTDIASVLSTTASAGCCRPCSLSSIPAEKRVVPQNRKIAFSSLPLCEHASTGSVSPPVDCNTGATSLMDVKSPQELCGMLIHVAVGWLDNYQSGFIHRDITVWNVLLLDGPIEDLQFTSKLDIIRTNWPPAELVSKARKLAQTSSKPIHHAPRYPIPWGIPTIRDVEREASRVETVVELLGISTSSRTLFTDSVMSIMWTDGMLDDRHSELGCGPQDFMSRRLYANLLQGSPPYLQHCVDDVDSLYWLAQWVAVLTDSEDETVKTARLRSNACQPESRGAASHTIQQILPDQEFEYDTILLKMAPVLVALDSSMSTLHMEWSRYVLPMAQLLDNREERTAFFLPWFHFFAYRSIAVFLEAFHEHGCQPKALNPTNVRPSTLQWLIAIIFHLARPLPFSSLWLPLFDSQGSDAGIG